MKSPSTDWAEQFEHLAYEMGESAERGKKGKEDMKAFIASEREKAKQEGRDEREKEIMDALGAVWSDETKARKGGGKV